MWNLNEYEKFVWNQKRRQEFMERAFRPPPPLPRDELSLNNFIDWLLEPPDFRLFAYKHATSEIAPTSFIDSITRQRPSRIFCDRLLDGTPREFEDLVATFFRQLGGQVVNGNRGADGAIDALWNTPSGDYIVQCKRRKKNIGEPVIREIFGVAANSTARGAFIVVASGFSSNATRFVEGLKPRIGLINGEELFNLMSLVMPTEAREIQNRSPKKK